MARTADRNAVATAYQMLRPILFRLDAERAHHLGLRVLRLFERRLATRPIGAATADARLAQTVCGIAFPNPVGLAAGFDKNAELPHVWQRLGFGFAELGTVTALAQPGNPTPRLFRLPADKALINRMGFNNHGSEEVARSLATALHTSAAGIPLGINLGKSKLTPLDDAAADYASSFRRLAGFAAYVVVNVSSPNTPGLRDLQSESHLAAILDALEVENRRLADSGAIAARKPVFVKVAPDLADDGLAAIVRVVHEHHADGIVATNTTIARHGLRTSIDEAGGLSGAPLRARATEVIRRVRQLAGAQLPIIGVGGIFSAADAYEKIRAGAGLVQVYTGFIYEGPLFARQLTSELSARLERDGIANVSDAVGRDA